MKYLKKKASAPPPKTYGQEEAAPTMTGHDETDVIGIGCDRDAISRVISQCNVQPVDLKSPSYIESIVDVTWKVGEGKQTRNSWCIFNTGKLT